jgi:hypothetical protein
MFRGSHHTVLGSQLRQPGTKLHLIPRYNYSPGELIFTKGFLNAASGHINGFPAVAGIIKFTVIIHTAMGSFGKPFVTVQAAF